MAAINRLVGEGSKEVNYFDAMFHIRYAYNRGKLAGWLTTSQLERAPKSKKKQKPTPKPPQ